MEGPADKWTYETEYFRYDGCYPKAMHDCIAFCVFKEYYMDNFELYIVDMKYVRNLKNIEKQKTGRTNTILSVSSQTHKQGRPFVGIVQMINGINYCIPLSSIEEKEKYWNKMVYDLFNDYNQRMDYNIHKYLNMYIANDTSAQSY